MRDGGLNGGDGVRRFAVELLFACALVAGFEAAVAVLATALLWIDGALR